jgi:hypothetical protein
VARRRAVTDMVRRTRCYSLGIDRSQGTAAVVEAITRLAAKGGGERIDGARS